MMDVRSKCAWELIMEGVPESSVTEWYDTIILNSGLSKLSDELTQGILSISDGDLLDLLTVYGEEGSLAALREMTKYFAKFYGITRTLPIVEDDRTRMMSCNIVSQYRKIQTLGIYVNPAVYKCDGAALLLMAVHEMRHAWQVDVADKWLAGLGKAEIDFSVNPQEAGQELLYYLNYRAYVGAGVSEGLYHNQLVEQEAYYATYAMMTRLGAFSQKVLDQAMQSMRATGLYLG